jgi:phosphoglycerol transferase MdoB-like AlkP superfamily enzyme
MIIELINNYQTITFAMLVSLIIIVGYLELRFIGRWDIACITWFWALVIAVIRVAFAVQLGAFRWIISAFIFAIGTFLLLSIYRKNTKRV